MSNEFPVIHTSRFILRKINEIDAKAIYDYFSDPDVTRYYGMEPFTEIQQALDLVNQFREGFQSGRTIRWGIAEKSGGRFIGTVGFHNWNKFQRRAEIGYEVHKGFWRQGVMTEVLKRVIPYGFSDLGLNRIGAMVRPENTASRKLLETLSFSEEGELRDYQRVSGNYYNLLAYSVLNRDWEKNL